MPTLEDEVRSLATIVPRGEPGVPLPAGASDDEIKVTSALLPWVANERSCS
jgi:hypothetical protein